MGRIKVADLEKLEQEIIIIKNSSQSLFEEIKEAVEKSKNANSEINGNEENGDNNGLLQKIKLANEEIQKQFGEIETAYSQILDNDDSIKNQLDNLLSELKLKQNKLSEFEEKIFGKTIKLEDGTEEKVNGVSKNLDELVNDHQNLYKKIEKELDAGATTVALAKVFADKADLYNKEEGKYSKGFIVLIGMLILYSILTIFTNSNSWEEIFRHLFISIPFFAFAIWLTIFIGNRRAENKKLEESYKHKEVMARAFIGYRESINELNTEDNKLLETHMENLLDTMNKDSSVFLDSKGDKHPLFDFLNKFITNSGFPEGSIETNLGKIEFKKMNNSTEK